MSVPAMQFHTGHKNKASLLAECVPEVQCVSCLTFLNICFQVIFYYGRRDTESFEKRAHKIDPSAAQRFAAAFASILDELELQGIIIITISIPSTQSIFSP